MGMGEEGIFAGGTGPLALPVGAGGHGRTPRQPHGRADGMGWGERRVRDTGRAKRGGQPGSPCSDARYRTMEDE